MILPALALRMKPFLLPLLLFLAASVRSQTIYHVSEQAKAGEAISVTGDGLPPSTTYGFRSSPSGRLATTTASSTSGAVALVTVPASLGPGVYRVVATAGGRSSAPAWVNRPRLQWLDAQSAMPGQSVRAVGRNLSAFGRASVVLANLTTKARVPVVPTRQTPGCLLFAVPLGTPAGSYKVMVRGGIDGGLAGYAPLALPLTVLPSRPDPLGVGTSWGADVPANVFDAETDARLPAHPVGDGVTEDGAAIAADLNWIWAYGGGGTLVLPAKTYRIDKGDDQLTIRSGVVLRGAGIGGTILRLGYVSTPDYHCPLSLVGGNALPEGIMDLTVQNVNASGAANRVLNTYLGDPTKAFLKRVAFQMGLGVPIDLSHVKDVVIEGCSFRNLSGGGTLGMGDAERVRYVGNTDYHRGGRLRFSYSNKVVVEGNTIDLDNAYRGPGSPEGGMLETNLTQRFLIEDNDLRGIDGPASKPAYDGEVILAQYAQAAELHYTGSVASATRLTLTGAAPLPASFTDIGQPSPTARTEVYVVSGRGMGQHRLVVAHSGASVTVDSPWAVVPDATSGFALESRLAYQHTIENNRLSGGFVGIAFEHGALDSVVQGNVLTNTGAIVLFGFVFDATGYGAAGGNASFMAGWENALLGNTVANPNGLRRSTLSLPAYSNLPGDPGPILLANDVRGNTTIGTNQPYDPSGEYAQVDGIEVVAVHRYPLSNASPNEILQQGTVVEGNLAVNSALAFRNNNVAPSGGSFMVPSVVPAGSLAPD